jgi:glycosyltransferase involved in cell wall biosynthesis
MDDLTVFVCTFNSGRTIEGCMSSIRSSSPFSKVVVVDHMSEDSTRETCLKYGAEFYEEDTGLGHARQMCFELCETRYMAFVDSDVEITELGFFGKACVMLEDTKVGAVVGMARGHRFAYGLPASLLVLRRADFSGIQIPGKIDARETYYIQVRLDSLEKKTVYLADAMIHRSQYRGYKPEWEGANTRIAAGLSPGQLAFAFRVIVLMGLNSRSLRNIAYVPLFYLKFLKGFTNPVPWSKLNRREGGKKA